MRKLPNKKPTRCLLLELHIHDDDGARLQREKSRALRIFYKEEGAAGNQRLYFR